MLTDYLFEYGCVPFSTEAITTLDLLAFCQLTNFDYPLDCLGQPLGEALLQARLPKVTHPRTGKTVVAQYDPNDLELAAHITLASRYEQVRVSGFATRFKHDAQQFGALALETNELLIIAFRGTDATFTGWREAFRLACNTLVPSHGDAVGFLESMAANTSTPIVLCGHSKGGNLAMHAGLACCASTFERIASIVAFDAPGFPKSTRTTERHQRLAAKLAVFIPAASLVGNVHGHAPASVAYIESKGLSFKQHYPYAWKTQGASFIGARQAIDGKVLSFALQTFIDALDERQRLALIDWLFDGLNRTGRVAFADFATKAFGNQSHADSPFPGFDHASPSP